MKPHPVGEALALFRRTCRKFAADHIEPHIVEWEEAEIFPRELYAKAGAAGILAGSFPKSSVVRGIRGSASSRSRASCGAAAQA